MRHVIILIKYLTILNKRGHLSLFMLLSIVHTMYSERSKCNIWSNMNEHKLRFKSYRAKHFLRTNVKKSRPNFRIALLLNLKLANTINIVLFKHPMVSILILSWVSICVNTRGVSLNAQFLQWGWEDVFFSFEIFLRGDAASRDIFPLQHSQGCAFHLTVHTKMSRSLFVT